MPINTLFVAFPLVHHISFFTLLLGVSLLNNWNIFYETFLNTRYFSMGKNNCGLKPVDTRKNDVNRVEYYLRFVVTVQFSSTRTFNATSFDHRPMFLYHCSYCTLSPLDVIWCGFFCMMCRDVRIKEIVDELCIWLDQLGTILGGNLPGFWQEQTATATLIFIYLFIHLQS